MYKYTSYLLATKEVVHPSERNLRMFLLIQFLILFGIASTFCSVSCKATPNIERVLNDLLKKSDELKDLDDSLNHYYKILMWALSESEKKALIQEQRDWIKERNQQLNSIDTVRNMYSTRCDALRHKAWLVLKKDVSTFINAKPSIDYNNPELNRALSSCQLKVCKFYKAFIDYDRSNKNPDDVKKAASVIKEMAQDIADSQYPDQREQAFDEGKDLVDRFLAILASKTLFDDIYLHGEGAYDFENIPLWVVLKFPQVLQLTWGRFRPGVFAETSIRSLKEFKDFKDIVSEMWSGRFNYTSYCTHQGSIISDLSAHASNILDKMSFAPGYLVENPGSIDENLASLRAWSMQGIWNRLTFKKFMDSFHKTASAMQLYYKQNYGLQAHSPQSELLLSIYTSEQFSNREHVHSKAFKVTSSIKGTLEELKNQTKDFNKEDWNTILHMAILSDFHEDTIKWILQSGADVNDVYEGETPLMNAITRPETMTLLLKNKANVHWKNPFGKTALFYAVQFGGKEAVDLLLKGGARVNDSLDSLPEITKKFGCGFYMPEVVAGFTPLVYALRYASEDVIPNSININAS